MGIPSVRRMMAEMGSDEIAEWIAYDRIEPIGRRWYQTGLICAVLANLWTSGRRAKPEDYIPRPKPRAARQTAAQMMRTMGRFLGGPKGPGGS